jgi:hypothetical protein
MKTFLFILFSFASIVSFAQDLEKVDGAAVYFKAGVNASNFINWDDGEPTNTLVSASGGMGVYVSLGKPTRRSMAMAIEGVFSGQGFALKHNDETIKARTTYFNLSAMLRKYFSHMYLTAGAEHGFLMSAREIFESGTEDAPEGIYKKGVWNGIGGIGVNFGDKYSRQVDFGLELTYRYGLSPVRTDFVKARHSVVNFSMFIPVSIVAEIASGF